MKGRRAVVSGLVLAVLAVLTVLAPVATEAAVPGELRRDDANPRWVTNDEDRSVVLTGSHHWHVYQDYQNETFDWDGYQADLAAAGHNFTRGWTWEDTHFQPTLFVEDLGGYDLSDVNHGEWTALGGNLRKRVKKARGKGLYTSVMFFQGWSTWNFDLPGPGPPLRNDDPWSVNPYNAANNVNGIDGDFTTDHPQGQETHAVRGEGESAQIRALQEDYVAFVVGKMKGFANVIWEVSNESPHGTDFLPWQDAMVDAIRAADSSHLILVSCQTSGTSLSTLDELLDVNPKAEVLAPCREAALGLEIGSGNTTNPFATDGERILLADSDHLGALDVVDDTLWGWKYFLRGYHPIFMDLSRGVPSWWHDPDGWDPDDPAYQDIAASLGVIQQVAAAADLRSMVPQDRGVRIPVKRVGNRDRAFVLYSTGASKSGLGQAADGVEYLALEPTGAKTIKVCKLDVGSDYDYSWLDPFSGAVVESGSRLGVTNCESFVNPDGDGRVLHVVQQ